MGSPVKLKSLLWMLILVLAVCGLVETLAIGGLIWRERDRNKVKWRREIIAFKALNLLPEETWASVARRCMPFRAPHQHKPLRLDASNLRLPSNARELFYGRCGVCHGAEGGGGNMGADLGSEEVQSRLSDLGIYYALTRGVEGTNMPASDVGIVDGLVLTAYVRSLRSRHESPDAGLPRGTAECKPCRAIQVSSADIIAASTRPQDWPTYEGDYSGRRFSPLALINRNNVSRLRPRFIYQTKSLVGLEATPLVVNGVMFLTGPENEVIALDLATGAALWKYQRTLPDGISLCCGRVNRGVALLGDRVFHATLDARLIALDVRTGKEVWNTEIADYRRGFSSTGAPLAIDGKIITGVAGGDFGIRGFIDAYDPASGKRLWRFETIPTPGQRGHETWQTEAWKTGGGATWMTGTYDPELQLIYWGTGNPAPDFNPQARPGDNLFTCSVVALDANTGRLRWHFQFNPNDGNDWDANEVPVLVDADYDGQPRKLLLQANRNCFYYVLDRTNGEFLRAASYCDQNWNDGFTHDGRPIRRPGTLPSEDGSLVRPGFGGGANWPPPAYSPITGLFYVRNYNQANHLFQESSPYLAGTMFLGGRFRFEGSSRPTLLTAIRGLTGEVAWQRSLNVRGGNGKAGVLATASGLVFTGDTDGGLVAFDAVTGDELWRYSLGGQIAMPPITYLFNGSQELAVIAGGSVAVVSLVP
jgi:alcohol dehydrogenase (cytochrome c)